MNRRDFARQLLMAAVGSQLIDVEKLLWVPKAMVTVPNTYVSTAVADAYVLGVLRRSETYYRLAFDVTSLGDMYQTYSK